MPDNAGPIRILFCSTSLPLVSLGSTLKMKYTLNVVKKKAEYFLVNIFSRDTTGFLKLHYYGNLRLLKLLIHAHS